MAYVFKLRRGYKWDINPDTGLPSDEWAEYEKKANHVKPLEGELVLEYDNGIPRLKIGDGVNEFSALPYISVDSFILPKPISVTLSPDKWEQTMDDNNDLVVDTYQQEVIVENATITPNSKIDLLPNLDQLAELYDLGIALTTENNNGTVIVYAVGTKPINPYTIKATVTEVIIEDEVANDE